MGMWAGKKTQEFPKWEPRPPTPKYKVPAGVRCAVRDVRGGDWREYTTKAETGYDKYERYERDSEGSFYEFRQGVWLILVHRRFVIHRETADELEKRLREWPHQPKEPRKARRRKRRRP